MESYEFDVIRKQKAKLKSWEDSAFESSDSLLDAVTKMNANNPPLVGSNSESLYTDDSLDIKSAEDNIEFGDIPVELKISEEEAFSNDG